jgi:hypothetical protein
MAFILFPLSGLMFFKFSLEIVVVPCEGCMVVVDDFVIRVELVRGFVLHRYASTC